MWDTFQPLRASTLWAKHDNPDYALSWNGKIPTFSHGLSLLEAATLIGRSA